jgi:hypothetical protein
MMAEPAGFLARWSRLKQQARRAQVPAPGVPQEPAPAPRIDPPPAELPPIETLTAESDFSSFMQAGVPDALRNAALQKLWRSDPVYANLDGLVEYGEDYAADFKAAAAVRTAYRVLRGMPEEAAAPTEPATDHDAATVTGPETAKTRPSLDGRVPVD